MRDTARQREKKNLKKKELKFKKAEADLCLIPS
jgi:hypothetical protein